MEIGVEYYEQVNAAEYGDSYREMVFLAPAETAAAEEERAGLLADLTGRANFACHGSKIHTGPLSPGCRSCVEGNWSCLFINNICNGRCFYCPTTQMSKSTPATNNLAFPNPKDYLDYLDAFGFTGASISGGEPLLTFERTLDYVSRIKKRFGDEIHLWLYSNGILADVDKIERLRAAGLDEMRFDISADGYNLDKVRQAAGRIPTITVEIPAIPEDYELLRDLLPGLAAAGVHHLNLHQLRVTPHNLPKLLARGYCFVHGPKVLVHGSELTALRLLRDSLDMKAAPPLNYCSFAYKSRYQGRAARLRAAARLVRPHEDITPAGYLRSLRLCGPAGEIDNMLGVLEEEGGPARWQHDGRERILLNAESLAHLAWHSLSLQVSYFVPQLRDSVSYRGSHQEVVLNRKRRIYAERTKVLGPVDIQPADRDGFINLLASQDADVPVGLSCSSPQVTGFERLGIGLFALTAEGERIL